MRLLKKTSFFRDDRGALTPLMLVMFTGIILTTGVALDLVRQESERTDLQDALDRGVVAAASLTQSLDPEATVREYLENRSFSEGALRVEVAVDEALNFRSVRAGAEYDMPTIFLRLAGLDTLVVPARATAAQGDPDVEISLVLDISGSMARENAGTTGDSRLSVLRTAASGFIDTVLTDAAQEKTTVSLVPFAGQVNAGPLFDILSLDDLYANEHCVEFDDSDFFTTSFPEANSVVQAPQFQWFRFEGDYGHEANWGWCPTDTVSILPFSNDPDALKAEIANFVGHDGTGTQIGMKFGLSLLDPATQPITEELVAAGTVDAAFVARPLPFNDNGALKFIVVMTDGNIRYQQRPRPEYANTASLRALLLTNQLTSSKATLPASGVQNIDEGTRSEQFQSLCDLAKLNGVVVFTIGFDIRTTDDAYTEMRNCASTPSHFYLVQGLELSSAFQQIATTISKLKLIE